ncbi:hypothetical protein AKUH4B410M_10900 [Apilactobacillus kunkeei]|nr:hypothetical protein [Apilactobacillus kunkeei]MCK8628386.1 hypothetical protein [Apilactobacillus kunkeei]CAI2629530.1 hypothetical protein AKUH4B405J_10910 [Apilactobacillus kunkeei]CAI2631678.1 hypothetical protein AKUH4B410M_10900 [Apilactobacillus kunkeei]CAI2632688.1 hypothetical protein AKUH4B102A_11180 [Apilactobacillus kunkeei]CAI2687784.1 hypothetical protein AKUH3B102X_10900 [Apilactobacillus kunkeei]
MISLKELVNQGQIEKTKAMVKLPIQVDGIDENILSVYKIPLHYLFYNDENGRISTGIAKYKEEITPSNDLEDSQYNDKISKMIENNNPNSLKKTQESISISGQNIHGWVLDDGRIIDGNRRFTALRNIHKKTGKTVFFEAVILPFSYNNDTEKMKIKKLELSIQMGIEDKEDYEPVDLALDIYRTTGGNNPIMTEADYADASKIDLKTVRANYDGVVYMKQFLDYIGAPADAFDIIKDARIWSLFYTMGLTLKKNFSNDPSSQVQKNRTINSYFATILYLLHVGTEGKHARTQIREYGSNIVSTGANDRYNDEAEDLAFDLSDEIKEHNVNNFAELSKALTESKETVENVGNVYQDNISSAQNGKSVDDFLKSVKKSERFLEDLNKNGGLVGNVNYKSFSADQIKQLQNHMRQINLLSEELFNKYAEESK